MYETIIKIIEGLFSVERGSFYLSNQNKRGISYLASILLYLMQSFCDCVTVLFVHHFLGRLKSRTENEFNDDME